MSVIRSVNANNPLPAIVFFKRFLNSYNEYHKNEVQRLEATKPPKGLPTALNNINIQFMNSVLDKIAINLDDLELMHVSTTFMRCLDDEMSLLKMEARRIYVSDGYLLGEIKRVEKLVTKLEADVLKLEKEKAFWATIFRARNVSAFKNIDGEVEFFPEEANEIEETPTPKTVAIKNVVQDFLKANNFELSLTYARQKMEELFKEVKKENYDIAYIYSLLGTVHNAKGEYKLAADQFKITLDIREKELGKDHKSLGPLLHNYALVLLKNRKLKEATTTILRGIPIMEHNYADSQKLAKYYAMVGKIYFFSGQWGTAAPFYIKAISTLEKIKQNESNFYFYVLGSLCKTYMKLKQDKNFESIYTKYTLCLAKRHEGKGDPNLYGYLRTHIPNADSNFILKTFGPYENYDVADYIEVLYINFQSSDKVILAIENWKMSGK